MNQFIFIFLLIISMSQMALAALNININEENITSENTELKKITNINITNESTKDFSTIKEIFKNYKPKNIFLEQWITLEPHNKKLLKKLRKLSNKYDSKLYLVVGKNTWFGRYGYGMAKASLDEYEKYIDGIVLRIEPNKTNIWNKFGENSKARILNQMLDSYAALHIETMKRNKDFIAEFPFWFSDFIGPLKSFPQDVCSYTDKIIFLIDDEEKLEELNLKWNEITCRYLINLTKRANNKTEEDLRTIYSKLKNKLQFFSNFHGYIVDSDSIEIEKG